MLKFWKKSENLNCKKSTAAKSVNFQDEVTVFQSSSADEIKTQISIQTKAAATPRKFKLFSIIKWRSKKRKRKNKNSSVKRKKSSKRKKGSKGKRTSLVKRVKKYTIKNLKISLEHNKIFFCSSFSILGRK